MGELREEIPAMCSKEHHSRAWDNGVKLGRMEKDHYKRPGDVIIP